MSRANVEQALGHFQACGTHYAALYHRALLQVPPQDVDKTLGLLRQAVERARQAGVYDLPTPRIAPSEYLFRALPFFVLRKEYLLKEPPFQALQRNPRAAQTLRELTGP
jgi:hypothetical protein